MTIQTSVILESPENLNLFIKDPINKEIYKKKQYNRLWKELDRYDTSHEKYKKIPFISDAAADSIRRTFIVTGALLEMQISHPATQIFSWEYLHNNLVMKDTEMVTATLFAQFKYIKKQTKNNNWETQIKNTIYDTVEKKEDKFIPKKGCKGLPVFAPETVLADFQQIQRCNSLFFNLLAYSTKTIDEKILEKAKFLFLGYTDFPKDLKEIKQKIIQVYNKILEDCSDNIYNMDYYREILDNFQNDKPISDEVGVRDLYEGEFREERKRKRED